MKAAEIRNLSKDAIKAKLGELETQLVKLRFQQGLGQLKQVHLLRAVKKAIARHKTILQQVV